MTPTIIFFIFIAIIFLNYFINAWIDRLNASKFNDPIPDALLGIYDQEEYLKSQQYKKVNHIFSSFQGLFGLLCTLLFFSFNGFSILDQFVRSITDQEILVTLLYFGVLGLAVEIIGIPFSYYNTFVIEEKFGFNKSTKTLFWIDLLKKLALSIIFGGLILYAITWFYLETKTNFWWITWGFISIFSVLANLLYSTIIVPLFNKQKPLEAGELRSSIEQYAKTIGFSLDKIFIIDGSKRSTKANAYFSGFGSQKRIVLYNTLIDTLTTNEIIAVLAHEVGHYKKKHIIYNLVLSTLLTGVTLFILSFFINSSILASALGVSIASFHIGIVAFSILYTPISEVTGVFMNSISRKFEYQADQYASDTYHAEDLISALKKLSKSSLSNLTPHPYNVFIHYSHPTLLQRIQYLSRR